LLDEGDFHEESFGAEVLSIIGRGQGEDKDWLVGKSPRGDFEGMVLRLSVVGI